MNSGNTKRHLKKEYIPLLIALLVLVVLVLMLIIVVFYKDNKGLKVPDLPEYERMRVNIGSSSSGKLDESSLSSLESVNVNVDYNIISDYYKNGIILVNPRVELIEESIVISNQNRLDAPYVSVIGLDCKLKWINKIEYKEYDYFSIEKILYDEKYIYAISVGGKETEKDLLVISFDKKNGSEVKREIIQSSITNKFDDAVMTDNGITVITSGKNNVIIYFLNYELKLLKNPYELEKQEINLFHSSKPSVNGVNYNNHVLVISLAYYWNSSESSYLLTLNLNNNTSSLKKFNALNNISNKFNGNIISIGDRMYTYNENKIYSFDQNGTLTNNYDYGTLKLEDQKEYKNYYDENGEKLSEVGEISNSYNVVNMYSNDKNIVVAGETVFNFVYDIFDSQLKLEKRYLINQFNYNYDQGVLLKLIYANEKIYQVYSYGSETASILISVIG